MADVTEERQEPRLRTTAQTRTTQPISNTNLSNNQSHSEAFQPRSRNQRPVQNNYRPTQEDLEIKHKAADVVSLIIPVSICMFCTVFIAGALTMAKWKAYKEKSKTF